ncbi:BgTH12-04946 [Blumeria graminis f. sp. triticale]|uniref:Ubiquitin-like protein ATG12 n=3 Tax=Blumeria graminis TaxID=34373 RepID=A0A061HDF8_BLUGR|nr:ubiquitin-like modifier [Blumeria graminis f. sp. tritici 96224]CAD6502353.1 BgTH12-04946 [Blumeria graminis f. sp. triticale]VDB87608.1 Bgt-2064 [Blumeria graminis f. sp. tritici]
MSTPPLKNSTPKNLKSSSPPQNLNMGISNVQADLSDGTIMVLAPTGEPVKAKVTVHFNAIGSAPLLRQNLCKISSTQRFEAIVAYLRRTLKVAPSESVFLYVNNSFAPALDEVVGNLHRCFKDSKDQLAVTYSMTPAFG